MTHDMDSPSADALEHFTQRVVILLAMAIDK